MQIITIRKGFTLIELIIVIIIMGIVATLISSRLSHFSEHSSVLTPATIKKYLIAFNAHEPLDLFCYDDCTKCDLWMDGKKVRSELILEHDSALSVVQFDHLGRLNNADPTIHLENEKMREGNFEFFLYPDGRSSALILSSKGNFFAYTPLSDLVKEADEEQLRDLLFHPELMNRDNYYGNR